MTIDYSALVREAFSARENAYAPYSNFMVGAALLTQNGKVYRGCNVENAAFTPTNCAERTAIFTAVCEGERSFSAIAVVGGNRDATTFSYCFPCGVCRQVLTEFCSPDLPIVVATSEQDYRIYRLSDLLPEGFGGENLNQ